MQTEIMPFREKKVRSMTRAERKKLPPLSQLDRELQKLGIAPFNSKSVHDYMERRVHDLLHPKAIVTQSYRIREGELVIGMIGCIVGMGIFQYSVSPTLTRSIFGAVLLMVSIVLIALGLRGKIKSQSYVPLPKLQAAWKMAPLESYMSRHFGIDMSRHFGIDPNSPTATRVPPEVMQTVQSIRAVAPDTEFFVHYLYEDPFLEVIHCPKHGSSSSRFVAFWDEDGYVH